MDSVTLAALAVAAIAGIAVLVLALRKPANAGVELAHDAGRDPGALKSAAGSVAKELTEKMRGADSAFSPSTQLQ